MPEGAKDSTNSNIEEEIHPSKLLSFSKEKRNIIVILLDMANGGYVQRALQDNPSLLEKYKDFVWYPNTLSRSTNTNASKPAILAGWQYTPENIANISGDNLAHKFTSAYDTMFNVFQSYKYQIGITGVKVYGKAKSTVCQEIRLRGITCVNEEKSKKYYVTSWLERHPAQKKIYDNAVLSREGKVLGLHTERKALLLVFSSVLRSIPISLRRLMYDDGNWHNLMKNKNHDAYLFALKNWAFVDSLSTLSTIRREDNIEKNEKNGTFTFIHTNITHSPYALDSSCTLRYDEYADPNVDNDSAGDAAYYSLYCSLETLSHWLQWMQKQGVYDNTKIIIVSDHGKTYIEDPMNINKVAPDMQNRKTTDIFSLLHVLLLVKDFSYDKDSHESLKINERFMSNADTAAIAFHGIDNYVADEKLLPYDPTAHTESSRILPTYSAPIYDWDDLADTKEAYPIEDKYLVKDNIFDPENWRKIK